MLAQMNEYMWRDNASIAEKTPCAETAMALQSIAHHDMVIIDCLFYVWLLRLQAVYTASPSC